MKTLFVINGAPYPPRSGGPLRSWQNITVLAGRGPVAVFSFGPREPGATHMPVAAEWTHIDSAEYPAERGLRARIVRAVGQRRYPLPTVLATAEIDRRLQAVIDRFQPDLVVLSHWKNGFPTPLKRCRNVLLDMHNVESLLGTDLKSMSNPLLRAFVQWRWRMRERDLARRADVVWVCGENDVRELAQLDPKLPPPTVWPNAVDVARYDDAGALAAADPTVPARNGATLAYVGFYPYRPNALAAKELIDEIFPRIAAVVPDARLLLVGARPTDEMRAAARRDPRIVVTDTVDDVRAYLAIADLCVIPLRSGGGTRLKILESFAARVPVISTAKGAEGIAAAPEREIRIAETSGELARAAIELLEDPAAREAQADAAYALVREAYSWDSLARNLTEALPKELR